MRVTLMFKGGKYFDGVEVERLGVVTPEGTVAVARNEDIIVIKVPGHNYWSGRGQQSYAGAEFEVYRVVPWQDGKVPTLGDGAVPAERVVDFPVRPPKGLRA